MVIARLLTYTWSGFACPFMNGLIQEIRLVRGYGRTTVQAVILARDPWLHHDILSIREDLFMHFPVFVRSGRLVL
jgi:hypothetical protein